MANKRIILLSDGTGNSAGKVWRTNVWRIFEALDLTSSTDRVLRRWRRHLVVQAVRDAGRRVRLRPEAQRARHLQVRLPQLSFASRLSGARGRHRESRKSRGKYGPWQSDDIFGFGFSRGAFTIRVVNGLICEQGLVSYQTEEELDRKVAMAYRAHRAEKFKSRFQVEWVFRQAAQHLRLRQTRQARAPGRSHRLPRPLGHGCRLRPPRRRNDAGRQPLSVAARTAGPAAQSKGSQGLSRPFARRRAHYFPSPAVGREAGDGCHRHQENQIRNELPRSGSPACIPMSAADIRMTRSPMYRSPGCCPRHAAAGSP